MTSTIFRKFAACLILGMAFVLASCGNSFDKYAVVLWTDHPEQFRNGLIVGTVAHSSIRKEFQVSLLDTDDAPIVAFDEWRLKVFDSRWAAEDYVKANKDYLESFAKSAKQALPVRKKADRQSDVVYRLKESEEVKIIGREKEKRDEAGLQDYWYEILTRTGTSGWVFGYQLLTDNKQGATESDPLLALAKNNWRPEDFKVMMDNGTLDLNQFRPEYGFFIYPEEKRLVLNLHKDQISLNYENLKAQGRNTWKVDASGMILTMGKDGSLYVEWSKKDKSVVSCTFINFQGNVQEIFDQESARRAKLVQELSRSSRNLVSDNFGTLAIQPDGSFTWTGFEALSPAIIPQNATGTGKVFIRYYLGTVLSNSNTALLSMDFDLPTGPEEVNFMYQIRSDGVRFEFVRKNQIQGLRLIQNQSNPQVVFFHY